MPARIVIVAGVNGAGKSSVAAAAIREHGGAIFDPDSAAAALRRTATAISSKAANAAAWELGRRGLARALEQGDFFALETTLGGSTITAMLVAAARQGAELHVSYIGLASVEQHIDRVARRVAAGGHAIPAAKIEERWVSSRENLVRLLPHLAGLRLYDNSAEADPRQGLRPAPRPLLHLERGRVVGHAPLEAIPGWAKPIVAAAFRQGAS